MPARLMEASADPNLSTCPSCGTLIDVTDEEPYAKIHCSNCGTFMRVRQNFANFEITGVLGEGGQGLVFRAVDSKLKRNVAVKLMRRQYSDDPVFVKRFESEARVTASLNHPNIVKVFSFGEDRGLLYLAMEMVDQGSLDAVMQHLGKVPEDRVLEVGIQIAKGLQAGLEKGLIHRDIKPGNILFADERTAKIVDFGLAVLVEKQNEEDGEVWATPFYVAPEKLDGEPEDFRSDMYSLAATLFHALAGRPPFLAETNSMSELKQIKSKPVRLQSYAPHVSNPTTYVIEKALAVKAEDRWASYAEFIENLEYAQSEFRKRPKVRTRALLTTNSRDSGGSWITMAVILMVVAGGLVFAVKRNTPEAKTDPVVVTPPKSGNDTAAVRYEQGRFQLLQRHFGRAAELFRLVFEEEGVPATQQAWSAFHEGIAELLNGRPVIARAAFERLQTQASEKSIGMDRAAGEFFQRFSGLALEKDKISLEEAEAFKKPNYESIALLALGLKNWQAGAYADAVALLRQFQGVEFEAGASWVAEYRTLITPYLEEHAEFTRFIGELTRYETAPEEAEVALQQLPTVRERIRTPGLREELKRIEQEVGPKVVAASTARREELARKTADMEEADTKALTSAKLQIRALCENYQFRDALNIIRSVGVKLSKNIEERDLLARRVEWLVQFKEQLIRDLTAGGGYKGTLYRKNGTTVPGAVGGADEKELKIRIGLGSAAAQWHELAPASILVMARSFFKPTLAPSDLATRQWRAGVFCIFTGLPDSEELMVQAATVNPNYRIDKALFFGEPTEESVPAASPQPAPAPAPPSPPDAAPATGLEMANDPLNPSNRAKEQPVIPGLRRPSQ